MSLATLETKSDSSYDANSKQIAEFLGTEYVYTPKRFTMPESDPSIKAWIEDNSPKVPEVESTPTPKKKRGPKPSSVKFEKPMQIPLEDIGLDDHFQVRVKKNPNHVRDYKKRFLDFKKGKIDGEKIDYPFDPIHVWRREGKLILIAGHHRFDAATEAGMETILAIELIGDEKDALFFAVEDNQKHGLKYTYGDHTLCIIKLLDIDPTLSVRRLQSLTGSGHSNCGKVKKKYLESKVSTSGQLTKPAKQKKSTPSQTKPIESGNENEIFRWELLEKQPSEDQILVVADIVERFLQKLDDKGKGEFREMIVPLIHPPADTPV